MAITHISRKTGPTLQAIIRKLNKNALKKHILNTTGLKSNVNYSFRNLPDPNFNVNANANRPKFLSIMSFNRGIPYGKNGYKPKTKTTARGRALAIQKRVLNAIHNFLTKPHRKIINNLGSFRTVTGARTISPRRSAMAAVFGNPNLANRMYTVGTGRSMSKNKNRLRVGKQVMGIFNKHAENYLNKLGKQPR